MLIYALLYLCIGMAYSYSRFHTVDISDADMVTIEVLQKSPWLIPLAAIIVAVIWPIFALRRLLIKLGIVN